MHVYWWFCQGKILQNKITENHQTICEQKLSISLKKVEILAKVYLFRTSKNPTPRYSNIIMK